MSAPAFVPIGTIQQFSVLGRDGVTGSAGVGTVVTGDVGSSPTPTITNFPPSTVVGGFTLHTTNDAAVIQARIDGQAAYAYLLGLAVDATLPDDLTGQVLTSGVYDFTSGAPNLPAGETLTLNGAGLFIFKVGSSLTANVNSIVAGTAPACNIYWQIGTSATLNGVNFKGSLFADASITIGNTADLEGRAIAGLGAAGIVSMADPGENTIGGCATLAPVTYDIYVNYTPQTTGCHRVCYRMFSGPGPTGPDATYCCIEDPVVITPAMVNVPRSFPVIEAGVTACDTGGPVTAPGDNGPGNYVYEGYVQPCCDPSDLYDVAWPVNVTFVVAAP